MFGVLICKMYFDMLYVEMYLKFLTDMSVAPNLILFLPPSICDIPNIPVGTMLYIPPAKMHSHAKVFSININLKTH